MFANAVDDDLTTALFLVNATATPLPATRAAATITGNFIAVKTFVLEMSDEIEGNNNFMAWRVETCR